MASTRKELNKITQQAAINTKNLYETKVTNGEIVMKLKNTTLKLDKVENVTKARNKELTTFTEQAGLRQNLTGEHMSHSYGEFYLWALG